MLNFSIHLFFILANKAFFKQLKFSRSVRRKRNLLRVQSSSDRHAFFKGSTPTSFVYGFVCVLACDCVCWICVCLTGLVPWLFFASIPLLKAVNQHLVFDRSDVGAVSKRGSTR